VDGEQSVSVIPLHLGHLRADSHSIFRSGIRWLIQPGQHCRANQVFAYCNVRLEPDSAVRSPPFFEEIPLQVAFAPRVAGRILAGAGAGAERGGHFNIQAFEFWDAQSVVAHIDANIEPDIDVDARKLRLLMLAGRPITALARDDCGLLPGWHSRIRAWWCDEGEMPMSLLSLGICDVTDVIIGEQRAFLEMFEASLRPAQMVFVPDRPLVPAAPVLLDQLKRKPAMFEAIAADMRKFILDSKISPSHYDWIMFGAFMAVLQGSPIKDQYTLITPSGTVQTKPADALLLSLNSEPQWIFRHKTLGYHVHTLRHHQVAGGPVFRAWLANAFELVKRSVDDIRRDYERLLDGIQDATRARAVVINRMSTSGYEDISSYAQFDVPMSDTLSSIAAKELNLMLHDLAEYRDLAIIDVDAMAAEFGGAEHLPDGIHQSSLMQAALRTEILNVLTDLRQQSTAIAAR
jgi:hypothetical protein